MEALDRTTGERVFGEAHQYNSEEEFFEGYPRLVVYMREIAITKKCPRCQLRYRWREKQCTHCSELTDYEIEKLKERYREEHKGNARLGRWFIFAAIIIMIGIALL